ncbi:MULTISPECIES: AbfB domain-containing protein [Streptosporangium]|uniref:AbfB domain-containing protein n=1 Tax=Streptosporangium TaxID=2000 RepID=UPI0035202FEA
MELRRGAHRPLADVLQARGDRGRARRAGALRSRWGRTVRPHRPPGPSASRYSFGSRDRPGPFLRHQDFRVRPAPRQTTAPSAADATFCATDGDNGQGVSWQSHD